MGNDNLDTEDFDKKTVKKEKIEKLDNKDKVKSKKVLITVIILLVLIIVGFCLYIFFFNGQENKFGRKTSNVDLKKYSSNYRMEDNTLSDFDLYFLKQNNLKTNIVYSPLSIKYTLQMISEGADNNTKSQIDAIIGNYSYNKYANSKNLSFANALFVNNKEKGNILESYKTNLATKYNAEIINDDFKNAKAINSWINSKTLNLIPNMLEDKDVQNHTFALVNALAIDMEWVKRIQPDPEKGNYNYTDYYVTFEHETINKELLENMDSSLYSIRYGYDQCSSFYFEQDPISSNDNGIKFSDKYVNFSSFSAIANKYDIVNALGEENIRNTVKNAYIKYINNPENAEVLTEHEKQYESNNYLDDYLDKYIEDINKNYGQYRISTDLSYYVDDSYNIFAKDLKEYDGTQLQYVAIMPKQVTLDSFVSNIDADTLKSLVNKIKTLDYNIFKDNYLTILTGFVPYFDFEYSLDLMKDLKSLGVVDVFDVEKSNLSKLSNGDSYIDVIKHKANISLNNEGIKAAAITYGGGKGAMCGSGFVYAFEIPTEVIKLEFDKPFMYLIRDKKTGEVWFTGTVYEPTEARNEVSY